MPTTKVGRARNVPLESGVYKYSRSKMYHKKAIYKFAKKTTPKAAAEKKPAFVEKKVGGAKNGGTRKVATNKPKFDYPTYSKDVVKTSKNLFSKQKHSLRPSLSAGVIAIVLAGVHKGKKVVVLKQLGTGLLLVSGPYALNGCPLRRVNQRYLLATKTKVDVSGVTIPEHVNDAISRGPQQPRRQLPPLERRTETFSRPRRSRTSPASRGRLTNRPWTRA